MKYYLKVNRDIITTYRNLQKWMDVISEIDDSEIIILCDNVNLIQNIVTANRLYPNTSFISSDRANNDLCEIVSHISDSRWKNACYAHLTTFLHAKEHAFGKPFWNIDADDTFFCVSSHRLQEILLLAESINVIFILSIQRNIRTTIC